MTAKSLKLIGLVFSGVILCACTNGKKVNNSDIIDTDSVAGDSLVVQSADFSEDEVPTDNSWVSVDKIPQNKFSKLHLLAKSNSLAVYSLLVKEAEDEDELPESQLWLMNRQNETYKEVCQNFDGGRIQTVNESKKTDEADSYSLKHLDCSLDKAFVVDNNRVVLAGGSGSLTKDCIYVYYISKDKFRLLADGFFNQYNPENKTVIYTTWDYKPEGGRKYIKRVVDLEGNILAQQPDHDYD